MSKINYRPEVDGLRAVAVLLVIFFHIGLGFPGGYVGVDVFFVISGYLITRLILKELASGQFSLANFWFRRVRRIMPASCVMVFVTVLIGYFILLPSDYEELAQSAIAVQLFGSNIFFWKNTGYFESSAELKPLLHTWSLAVEEQFYLFYPLVLVGMHRFCRRYLGGLIGGALILSSALCFYGMTFNPGATFFLLPTRGWELLIGAAILFLPRVDGAVRLSREFGSAVGLLLILGTSCWIDSETPFPGVWAWVPTIGTAMVIHLNSAGLTATGRFLAWRPVVFFGLISYSLYLWHWPILAYLRYVDGVQLSPVNAGLALIATLIAGLVSWRFVETPLRRIPENKSADHAVVPILTGAALIMTVAAGVWQASGVESRVPTLALEYDRLRAARWFERDVDTTAIAEGNVPAAGDVNSDFKCVLWGDSHAMSLSAGFAIACDESRVCGYQLTRSSTPPVLGFDTTLDNRFRATTQGHNDAVKQFILDNEIDVVFLAAAWHFYAEEPLFAACFQSTLDEFTQRGVRVVVVRDVGAQEQNLPLLLAQKVWRGEPMEDIFISHQTYEIENAVFNQHLSQAKVNAENVLDPAPLLTDGNKNWLGQVNQVAMYCDEHHLSEEGSLKTVPLFAEPLLRWRLGSESASGSQ